MVRERPARRWSRRVMVLFCCKEAARLRLSSGAAIGCLPCGVEGRGRLSLIAEPLVRSYRCHGVYAIRPWRWPDIF